MDRSIAVKYIVLLAYNNIIQLDHAAKFVAFKKVQQVSVPSPTQHQGRSISSLSISSLIPTLSLLSSSNNLHQAQMSPNTQHTVDKKYELH